MSILFYAHWPFNYSFYTVCTLVSRLILTVSLLQIYRAIIASTVDAVLVSWVALLSLICLYRCDDLWLVLNSWGSKSFLTLSGVRCSFMGRVKFPRINKFDLLQVVLVLTSWTACANWDRYLRCVAFRIQIEFGNRALPFFVPLLKLRSDNRCQNQFLMSLWTDPQCLFGWTISKHLTLGFGIDRCCFRSPDARSNISDFGKFWN